MSKPALKAARRKKSPGRRQFANDKGAAYPAPTPKNPPMRTDGEATISTERVTMSVRMRFNPLRSLTPDRLAQYLDQFDLGFFRSAAVVWDRLERRDYTIKIVAPRRKKAVARRGYEIVTIKKAPAGMEAMAQQQAEDLQYFYDNLSATDALRPDQSGGLSLLARQMMDAQSKYYAVHELVWQPSPNGLTAQFVFCPLWWFEGTTGKLRYMDSEFQVYGRDMLPSEWLVTVGEGIMEATSVAWMFKHLSLSDWLAYCEKFGQPFIDAATSASPGSDEWNQLVEYAQNFGPDGGGVRSQGAQINLVEPHGSGGTDTYSKMVENMDRAITKMWRGGDLGTSSSPHGTGASLQEDETEILETDDCALIEETLATQISRFVIAWRHGPDAPMLAYLKFRRADKQNVDQDLKIDQFLLDAGAPLAVKDTLERYARSCPDSVKESDLLTPTPKLPALPDPAKGDIAEMANVATDDLTATLHEILLPLIKRLDAISKIDDATIQQHLLEKLLKDYPQIAEAIRHDNSLAKELSAPLAGALVAGLSGKKSFANVGDLPGHGFHGNQHTGGIGGAAEEKIRSVMDGKLDEAAYAPVTPEVAGKIKAATGKDVSGYQHFIDHDALVHIDRQHGIGKEDQAGHLPVTKDDIAKIPQIVSNPDKVEDGGKSGRGLSTVKYTKRFNGTTYYVEEEWAKEKMLAAKTMFKTKTP